MLCCQPISAGPRLSTLCTSAMHWLWGRTEVPFLDAVLPASQRRVKVVNASHRCHALAEEQQRCCL